MLNTTSKPTQRPCQNDEEIVLELSKSALKGPTIPLRRWREYDIEVVLEDLNTGEKADVKIFTHNTFRWVCPGNCHQTISQKEFCDGTEHCPGGADESKKWCEVSKLPQKSAYGFYGWMLFIITIYGMFMISNRTEYIAPNLELNPEAQEFQKEDYKQRHVNENVSLSQQVKEQTFDKLFDINDDQASKVFKEVKEAEVEVHKNAKEAYDCVLNHYGGDHPITARLTDPSGGSALKVKKYINGKVSSSTRWFSLNISTMFIFLCLHHFDYIKDIGDMHIQMSEVYVI